MSAVDLVRAAMSEVKDYPRVQPSGMEQVRVVGSVAPELAHLLAELIENGLNFSPPHAAVIVTGRRDVDGYAITVADRGIGMTVEALAAANAKVGGLESFDVAPTRFLGHHVVGQLARRLGARVALDGAAGAGTTATVHIPAGLLVEGDQPSAARRAGTALAAFSSGHRRGEDARARSPQLSISEPQ